MNGPADTIPADVYMSVCCLCGWPLLRHQIAARHQGDLIDYQERMTACNVVLDFCSECHEKIKQYTTEDIGDAIRRMQEMKNGNC